MKNTKQTVQQVNESKDLLDVLLDRENRDPILLMDENSKSYQFAQIAVIPYDVEGQDRLLYTVLKPLDKIDGIEENEALVFRADTDEYGNSVLKLEEDERRAIEVFNVYYDLLEEQKANKKKNNKL